MKTITLMLALAISNLICNAQETANGKSITVTIENISNNNGHILLSLQTEETFMKGLGIQNKKTEIVDGKIKVTFDNVEAGTYTILALHDENDNSKMDFEVNGMPKESYGMSNNPIMYGPPQFSLTKFDYKGENLEMKITF